MARWTEYEASFDTLARNLAMPVDEAMVQLRDHITLAVAQRKVLANEAVSTSGEIAWHESGRPAYRVAATLAEALLETRLDIDSAYVRFPHRAFSIELPQSVRVEKGGRRLLGLLVSCVRERDTGRPFRELHCTEPDGEGQWYLNVTQRWEGDDTPVNFMLTLRPGVVIADRVDRAFKIDPVSHVAAQGMDGEYYHTRYGDPANDPMIAHDDVTRRLISLSIGAAMFAVSGNHQFRHRLHPKKQRKVKRRRVSHPPEPTRWVLGADIKVPRGRSEGGGSSDSDETRSLRFRHIRQGHLAMRRCGPRTGWRYELRYIAPTIVRPDLDPAPRATRHRLDYPA